MFLLPAGSKTMHKRWQVSYYKPGEGIKASCFSSYKRALEFYEEKKELKRRKLEMQLMVTITTVEKIKV